MKINENEQLLLGIRGGVGGVPPPQQLLAEPAAGDPGGGPPPTNCWKMLLWGSGGGYPLSIRSYRGHQISNICRNFKFVKCHQSLLTVTNVC